MLIDYLYTFFVGLAVQIFYSFLIGLLDLLLFVFFFRATPMAYGGSQVRGPIGATAAGQHHSHSNARSEPRL